MGAAGVQPQVGKDPDAGSDPARLLDLVQSRLSNLLPVDQGDARGVLAGAARAGLLSGGKRIRPVLAMLACVHAGGSAEDALDFGCAVEMTHSASLVLDDLPCMDDAQLRRGAPTVHRAYGEDAAVLAAIALLNQAHRVLMADPGLDPARKIALDDCLTAAVGFDGLAHGQMRDLRDADNLRTEAGLRRLNHLKTGALFVSALQGGGMIAGAPPARLSDLATFGELIGFAFQLCDDLLDATSTPEETGKDAGQDRNKRTFIDVWGADRVKAEIRQAIENAERAVGAESPLSRYARGLFRNAGFAP